MPLARIAARIALLAISQSTKIDAIVNSSKLKLSAGENDPSQTDLQTLALTALCRVGYGEVTADPSRNFSSEVVDILGL